MPDIAAKILLVDDDTRSLMAMETLLAGPGRIVIKADSGQEALRQVLRHEFAVILLDVRMPRVGGLELVRAARQRDAQIGILVFTAYPSVESAVEECDRFYPVFQFILWGDKTPAEALAAALVDAAGEA